MIGEMSFKSNFFDCTEKGFFFNCYLAAPLPTLGHSQGDTLTNLMLITAFELFWSEGHRETCNKIRSLNLAKHLVVFEPGTFWFWS